VALSVVATVVGPIAGLQVAGDLTTAERVNWYPASRRIDRTCSSFTEQQSKFQGSSYSPQIGKECRTSSPGWIFSAERAG
jgi:hypothetical protein